MEGMSSDLPETVPQRAGLTGRTITIERLTHERVSQLSHVGELCLADRIDGALQGTMRGGPNVNRDDLVPYARKTATEVNAEFVA